MTSMEKLIAIASAPLCQSPPIISDGDAQLAGAHADDLRKMLALRNGVYAFEGVLHVFPSHGLDSEIGLDEWNSVGTWRDAYGDLGRAGLFFAEDVFGGQFCLSGDGVYGFDPETGELSFLSEDIEGWAAIILDDYEVMTGQPLAQQWQKSNGAMPAGHRLAPKIPFVAGGEYSLENIFLVNAIEGMRFRADIARQIADLPDGSAIVIEVTDEK